MNADKIRDAKDPYKFIDEKSVAWIEQISDDESADEKKTALFLLFCNSYITNPLILIQISLLTEQGCLMSYFSLSPTI